jgi:hypothetical protein
MLLRPRENPIQRRKRRRDKDRRRRKTIKNKEKINQIREGMRFSFK